MNSPSLTSLANRISRGRIIPALSLFFSLIFLLPPLSYAGSTLNFPRINLDEQLLTGIAIANPTDRSAVVTLTAYGADGSPLYAKDFKNPAEITIPAGQQYARVASELFGTGYDPGLTAWVQATSPADGLTAFFLLFNSPITLMDGAEVPDPAQKLIFNHIRIDSGFTTEFDIVNPGSREANVQIQLVGDSGILEIKRIQIAAKGAAKLDVAEFYGVAELSPAAYVTLDSDTDLVGFELVKGPGGDAYAFNARPSSERLGTLYFLQLSVLGSYRSGLGVVNYSSGPVILTISALKPDGSLFDSAAIRNNPVTRILNGGESLYEDVAAMFGFHGDGELEGSISVKSTADAINGYVSYGRPATGAAAIVTSAAQGHRRAIFSHVATSSGYFTGLTLFNPGTLAANVRVMVLQTGGQVVGTYNGVLQPGQRLSRRVGTADFIPQAVNQVGGLLWVKSDLPLFMSSIIGNDRAWTNIPPQDSPDGYNPDSGISSPRIKPVIAIVPPGSSQRFTVEGARANPIWKVDGTPGGSAPSGTISSQGVFTAPKTIPARQVVTITAEVDSQSTGASADVLAKSAFISDLSVIKSVVYLESLAKIFAAELISLGAGSPRSSTPAPSTTNSQIFEVSPAAPKTPLITLEGENIVKIISFKVSDVKEYMLLLGQSGGRIIRLDPATGIGKEVVTGLNAPTSMVFDPLTGDLLVVERDVVSAVSRNALYAGLSTAPEANKTPPLSDPAPAVHRMFAVPAAAGIAVDKCTGKIYFSEPSAGSIVEYDRGTKVFTTIVSGLRDPGQMLGLYRQGVTCPDSFHLLVTEKGANRVLLIVPQSGAVLEWVQAPGIEDLTFVPIGNSFTPNEGVLLANFTLESKGAVFLVQLTTLYDDRPPNPPEASLVPLKANISVTQTHSPAFIRPSEAVEFLFTVINRGPLAATGVTLLDKPPANATFASATASQGACNFLEGNIRCDLGTLESNARATVALSFIARYSSVQGAFILENSATVSCSEVDPDPTNNFSRGEATVLPSPIARFDVSSYPVSLMAGGNVSLTVTARDALGYIATSYAGKINFNSTDGSATLPASYTFTSADNGSHSFPASVVMRTSGTHTVKVKDANDSSIEGNLVLSVIAAPIASFQFLSVPASFGAGSPFNVVVNAIDGFGNLDPTFRGQVHFASSDPQAGLPADYAFVAADGGARTFPIILKTAGTQTVTVTAQNPNFAVRSGERQAAGIITGTMKVSVSPAAAALIQLTGIANSLQAGTSAGATVTARDAYGNVAPSYAGTVRFSSTDAVAILPTDYTFSASDAGTHSFPGGITLRTAGSRAVTATDTIQGSFQSSLIVTVTPAPATSLTVSGMSNPAVAGTPTDAVVSARDPFGNVDVNYRGSVRFTSTDVSAVLPADHTFLSVDAGIHSFAGGVLLKTAGNRTVAATDLLVPAITGSQTVAVTPAAAASLQFTGLPASLTAGTPSTITLTARDPYSNVATGYRGAVSFTSNDGLATLPPNYTFTAGDAGTRAFPSAVVLRTAGSRTVIAADLASPSIAGSQTAAVSPGPATVLRLTGLPASMVSGQNAPATVTAYDNFGNVAAGYLGTVTITSSDPKACLPGAWAHTYLPSDNGIHLFGALTLVSVTTGSQSVTASDGALTDTVSVSITPNVSPPLVVTASSTPAVPADLKITCVAGPNSFTPIPCPILRWGGYTYWAFSYIDNRFGMAIVAYNCAGNLVRRWDLNGARYLYQITVDTTNSTVTFWGQSGATIVVAWSTLVVP